jgi:hypothetical protein
MHPWRHVMRKLYYLTVKRDGREVEKVATHLDLDTDEAKLRRLLFDGVKRDGRLPGDVGNYVLEIRAWSHDGRPDTTYVTTEDS